MLFCPFFCGPTKTSKKHPTLLVLLVHGSSLVVLKWLGRRLFSGIGMGPFSRHTVMFESVIAMCRMFYPGYVVRSELFC